MSLIRLYLSIVLMTSFLYATEKSTKLKSDKSVSFNERKAVFSFPYLGSDSMFISIPVYDCTKGSCQNVDSWSYHLSDEILYRLLDSNIDTLIGKRFDKIEQISDGMQITTVQGVKRVPHIDREFQLGRVGFNHHKTRVHRYIDRPHFKKSILRVLKESLNSRIYEEQSKNSEKSSVNIKGKSLSITPEIQKKVLNSSYFFVPYIEDISGDFEINSPKKGEYTLSLTLNVDLKLAIYHYNYEKNSYELYRELEGSSSMFNPTAGGLGTLLFEQIFGGSSSKPTKRDGFAKFTMELSNSFESAIKDLSMSLKKDSQFRVQAPIDNRSWRSIKFNMGTQEDLRVDSTVAIFRFDDENQPIGVGWSKVREVGNNGVDSKNMTLSEASIINDSRSVEAFDLAVEYPWSGTLLSIGYGLADREIIYRESPFGDESSSEINIDYSVDLGHLFNFSIFSEIWFNIGGSGFSSDFKQSQESFSISGDYSYSYAFGFEKRFYLFSPLYVTAGFDYGEEISKYTLNYSNSYRYYQDMSNSVDLKIKSSFLEPKVKLGYSFTPNFELFLKASYRKYLNSENSLYDGDDEVNLDYISFVESEQFERDSHLKFMFGVSMNSDVFENIFNLNDWSE